MHGPEGEGSFAVIRDLFLGIIASYGWIIVGVIAVIFLLKSRVQTWLASKSETSSSDNTTNNDAELLLRQQEARERLQVKYDEAARLHAEKLKQKDAEARQQRLEELNRMSKSNGNGQRLGSTPSASDAVTSKVKKPTGPRLRGSDYNPLTGSSGSGGYRPSGSSRNCGPKGG